MFFAITGAIWMGGAGVVIVGGLYWKRGTTLAAFVALIVGSGIATSGVILQKIWAGTLYPLLESQGWLAGFTRILENASGPFEPYIVWRVTAIKFPINSIEIVFGSMLISIFLYLILSLLSRKEPFNMERMLHRGKYQREGKVIDHGVKGWRDALRKLIGINEEYTRGDKIITWSVFIWSFVLHFIIFFFGILIWNLISPWPPEWWANWFFFQTFVLGGFVALVSTVWFTWGGTRDLFRLFRDLERKEVDDLDDGRVVGHVSVEDLERVRQLEQIEPRDSKKKR